MYNRNSLSPEFDALIGRSPSQWCVEVARVEFAQPSSF